MPYCLKGKPIGISAAQSVFEAIIGLKVKARKFKGKVFVAKEELVARLKEKKSMYLPCWENTNSKQFEFLETDCQKVKN